MNNIKTIAVFVMSISFLSGCTTTSTGSENKISLYSKQTETLGNEWESGQKLVQQGNELIEEGNEQVEQGKVGVSEGRKKIRQGNNDLLEGSDLVMQGNAMMQISESKFNSLLTSAESKGK